MQEHKSLLIAEGGLGDFLQFLPFMLANKPNRPRYLVLVHFKGVQDLFKKFGIKVERFVTYTLDDEKAKKWQELDVKEAFSQVPRTLFFESNPFKPQKPVFNNGRKTIGIHLNGSKNSLDTRIKQGKPPKELPPRIVGDLSEYNILLFGLPEEVQATGLKQSDTVKFITYLDIYQSLSYVAQCDAMVASDSSIKSMSSMLRIPTFLWMGDNEDYWRDLYFVDPYVKEGVMKTFRYVFAGEDREYQRGLQLTKDYLNDVLSA